MYGRFIHGRIFTILTRFFFYDFAEIFIRRVCQHTHRARARARAPRALRARDARALAIERADIDERARAC